MNKKEKNLLKRILIAGAIFFLSIPLTRREQMFDLLGWGPFRSPALDYIVFPVFLISYLIIGGEIVLKALKNIRKGQVFDENFLMSIATIGAFCLGEYAEGVAVMLFYQVGELFQSYAVSRSRRSIADLMDIRPDYANVMRDGQLVQADPDEVAVGDTIVVKPGERIPLDGVITDGRSALDTSALTGESVPRDASVGDTVISGCINQTGKLTIKVTKEFGESTVSKILELVENASDKKSKSENFITRFARYYTPVVVFAAIALAIIPPLVTDQSFLIWIERALTFLVISCPCALVISVPLSFFGGIGGASKAGVLVKGSNYLELLADTEIVVFDKTGTLTKGNFVVGEVCALSMSKEELVKIAAHAEDYSSHPIAVSIKKAYGKAVDPSLISDIEEIAGHGVQATIGGKVVLAGNAKLMKLKNIAYMESSAVGTVVHVAVDGIYAGYIVIADEIKPDSAQAILELKAAGVKKTVMLTGDADAVGKKVADHLKLDKAYTELLPADKVMQVEKLISEKSEKKMLAFVGDGINDAPVLARADVGIAMGGLGSDAAIEAADVVIMTDEPSKIATVMKISRKTLRIVRQNITFSLAVKGIVLVLGAFGIANMWGAIFADVGVSIIAILNAIRALNVKKFTQSKR
ncbi:heavy metal translocating P-type ATPase [Lacrimispora sp.]|uniref:heavy metal translocating P-type ATPase n=1 Tax=Lacrimispora sp. TaxID=2719234 RepID=UPI00289C1B80|nr:heavy metal translocating P-type ATPase [Lacrimispora sp.]